MKLAETWHPKSHSFGYDFFEEGTYRMREKPFDESEKCKLASYVPVLSTYIAVCRSYNIWTKEMDFCRRMCEFIRVFFEAIPGVNLLLIPIDFIATIKIALDETAPFFFAHAENNKEMRAERASFDVDGNTVYI